MNKYILMLPCNTYKVSLLSRKHEKRAFILRFPTKISRLLKLKDLLHGLVQKILETCERVANIFLHPGANYTYMFNLHTVCKSAHVNGALVILPYFNVFAIAFYAVNLKCFICIDFVAFLCL